ncbi:hypothetical protein V1260_06980 [Brachybacterium sp. J144]|uniref:hypothetical protein n=1 Tax=Brachybacterium sp. J144 TaxID=3116487 RepID=UPI002E79636A|nr:hypothetical protein [Brachybacterium sp. J144]MEE1650533.1 hypothetical protein [Brachybacterium sp. J144]
MTTTTTRRATALRRLGLGAAALVLLASGCAGTAPTTDAGAPAEGREAAAPADAQGARTAHDAGEQGDQGDQGEGDQGQGGQGDQDDQGEGDGSGDDASTVPVPAAWEGTLLAERLPEDGDTHYLALQNFYLDDAGATEMTAAEIMGQEFFGSLGADCEGTAVLDGSAASCTFTEDGRDWTAEARIVRTPFDGTGLLILASDGERHELVVPEGAVIGFSGTGSRSLDEVTAEEVEGAAINGVLLASSPEGPLPADVSADCELLDGGEHAICEVTGTPDGAGDGTYLLTSQNRYAGEPGSLGYLVTELPAA